MAKRGGPSNKKGHYFQRELSRVIGQMSGFDSGEVDEYRFSESIQATTRDKTDNYVLNEKTRIEKPVSAKCPSNLSAFQMSALANQRQVLFLKDRVGFVPQVVVDFMNAYFGHVDYDVWMDANDALGVDVSVLSEEAEIRRQRTLGKNIPENVKVLVVEYFSISDVKRAFVDMHLVSGFTDKFADFQIYHPASSKKEIDETWETDDFYAIDLNFLRSECLKWELDIGDSTSNFGPLNWKVRGGGGDKCTPTKGAYHTAQCFSGINKMREFIPHDSDAFRKGTLKEILHYMTT